METDQISKDNVLKHEDKSEMTIVKAENRELYVDNNFLEKEQENIIKASDMLFCNICDFQTQEQRNLDHHKEWHNGHKFNCISCDFYACKTTLLEEHMNLNCKDKKYFLKVDKTDPDEKILLCYAHKCHFISISQTKMEAHVSSKHGVKEEVDLDNNILKGKFDFYQMLCLFIIYISYTR